MFENKPIPVKGFLFCILLVISFSARAQCPPNIGFELGNLSNWDSNLGSIDSLGNISLSPGADPERQKIYRNTSPQELDKYGGFPVNCPNGSAYSIRLGDLLTGKGAEQVSYTFKIPANADVYSIIYNYAVVLQNPNHEPYQQPKFTAKVFDIDNNAYIECSSFNFTAAGNLPGFFPSNQGGGIVYKPWSPVTIKLSGHAGATIRLEFTTNDCTKGGHFGYAYLDVDENCGSPISGTTYCTNDKSMSLVAPYGFSNYRWFNSDFSKVLATGNPFLLTPPPTANTVYPVEVQPYPELGCLDTLYATIKYSPDTVHLVVNPAESICQIYGGIDLTDSLITKGSAKGLHFSYYSDASLTTFVPTPKDINVSGVYYIKAVNASECKASGQTTATILPMPVFKVPTDPVPVIKPAFVNLENTITPSPGVAYTFWKDSLTTIPLLNPEAVNQTGTYYIKAINTAGCYVIESLEVIVKNPAIVSVPNIFSPNGDGIYDTWEIPPLKYYPSCIVEVFTRTGQLLFHSVGYDKPWDGTFKGKPLPLATYYYLIKPVGEKPIGGSVTIVK